MARPKAGGKGKDGFSHAKEPAKMTMASLKHVTRRKPCAILFDVNHKAD